MKLEQKYSHGILTLSKNNDFLPPTFETIQSGIHKAATAKQSAIKNNVKEMTDSLSIAINLHYKLASLDFMLLLF